MDSHQNMFFSKAGKEEKKEKTHPIMPVARRKDAARFAVACEEDSIA